MTVKFRTPLRANNYQQFAYTFKDRTEAPIDLSDFASVELQLKMQGAASMTVTADFVNKVLGTVVKDAVRVVKAGVWDAAFVCDDGSGNKLYGEPVQFKVVPNIEDVGPTELLEY